MSAEKLSVSLESETLARARRAADRQGVPLSRWLNRAAMRAADLEEAHAALEAHFSEHGEPTSAERTEAKAELEAAGVGMPIPLDESKAGEEVLAYLDRVSKAGEA